MGRQHRCCRCGVRRVGQAAGVAERNAAPCRGGVLVVLEAARLAEPLDPLNGPVWHRDEAVRIVREKESTGSNEYRRRSPRPPRWWSLRSTCTARACHRRANRTCVASVRG